MNSPLTERGRAKNSFFHGGGRVQGAGKAPSGATLQETETWPLWPPDLGAPHRAGALGPSPRPHVLGAQSGPVVWVPGGRPLLLTFRPSRRSLQLPGPPWSPPAPPSPAPLHRLPLLAAEKTEA